MTQVCLAPPGSNVMRSIHGVGELMTQVVLRGGGFLPVTPMAAAPEGNVKQAEPEKEDIMVMDTKLKIIEILQVALRPGCRAWVGGGLLGAWGPAFREGHGGEPQVARRGQPFLPLRSSSPSPTCRVRSESHSVPADTGGAGGGGETDLQAGR